MKQFFTKKNIYIILFTLLYIGCCVVSITHAVSFFGLANVPWMAISLSVIFEIGQAAVLFSLLTSKKDRKKILPWILMSIFTIVQVLGNVFSSYKYLLMNSADQLQYFKDPIFIWTNIPDAQCNVILSYLLGGLLPITCLALTSMVTNFLEDDTIQEEIIGKPEMSLGISQPEEESPTEEEDVEVPEETWDQIQEEQKDLTDKVKELIDEKPEIPTGFVNL